jgi:TrmH RNA methyltransferase
VKAPSRFRPPKETETVTEKAARIAGLPAVAAVFANDPERALRLYYDDSRKTEAGPYCAFLARKRRPYRLLPPEELARVAGTVLHGGIVAVVRPKLPLPLAFGQARSWARAGAPVLLLDGVGNPHNLGAIARTLAFFGGDHLVLSDHPAQAGLSDAAYRVAEGGLEYLQVHTIRNCGSILHRLHPHYRIIGTALTPRGVAPQAVPADDRPPLLVLGNEEEGLPAATLAACETVITIPGCGRMQSLNVAATAAILIYTLFSRVSSPASRSRPSPS